MPRHRITARHCSAEEIAQATLRRQYKTNYLEARQQFGKTRAERLFLKLRASLCPHYHASKYALAQQTSFTKKSD